MVVYSTVQNGKDEYLEQTLESLSKTVDFTKHRLILSINGKTDKTIQIFLKYKDIISRIIENNGNIGTAEAINQAWRFRMPNEHCIKIDDDVIIHQSGWVELMCDIARNNPKIGQIGLKRPDLLESPDNPNPAYRSVMIEGKLDDDKKITLEKCPHIMGTCVMHTTQLLKEIGYMWQPRLYGFDDSFTSLRSTIAGLWNVFIPDIKIDHIDRGGTDFTVWKQKHSSDCWDEYHKAHKDYMLGNKDIYYNPFEK